MKPEARPVSLLIAALGGEGGGVLTNWIVSAATACDLPVQSTSIPGVAQRTGATTYYLEIFPRPYSELDGCEPVLALYPAPGRVDIMVASELLEAARAMENGFITPDRTTLIASTHRVYAIAEKSDMADGRYDRECILGAMEALTRERRCADFAALAEQENTALNAVLLGLIASTGQFPIAAESLAEAIEERGVAVDANLRGFHAGLNWKPKQDLRGARQDEPRAVKLPSALGQRIADTFPAELRDLMQEGAKRTLDFQDEGYATLYLDRAQMVLPCDSVDQDYALCRETCRYLALWMTYEDIIRVADLKTRPERYARVRGEAEARPGEPVLINEYLKPGVDEVAAVLPAKLGRGLRERRERLAWMSFSLRVGSHTILGHRLMRLLACCRRWRPNSLRWEEEQALIERWLSAVRGTARVSYGLAVETALCANLNKGYGETFDRGRGNFIRILESLVEPAIADGVEADVAERVKSARTAALDDDTGAGLNSVLQKYPVRIIDRAQPEPG